MPQLPVAYSQCTITHVLHVNWRAEGPSPSGADLRSVFLTPNITVSCCRSASSFLGAQQMWSVSEATFTSCRTLDLQHAKPPPPKKTKTYKQQISEQPAVKNLHWLIWSNITWLNALPNGDTVASGLTVSITISQWAGLEKRAAESNHNVDGAECNRWDHFQWVIQWLMETLAANQHPSVWCSYCNTDFLL